jgi:hypothetical protein
MAVWLIASMIPHGNDTSHEGRLDSPMIQVDAAEIPYGR